MQTFQSEFTSIPVPPAAAVRNTVTPNRVPLWRLHGATDDLVCAAVVTSYGYALCLELGGEVYWRQTPACSMTRQADLSRPLR